MTQCPFCGPPDPNSLVAELPHSFVLLGRWQYYAGYCVVASKAHGRELRDLPDPAGYLADMARAAEIILGEFRPHKLNYEMLGNVAEHPHFHLFPRDAADPERLRPVWPLIEAAERAPDLSAAWENRPAWAELLGRLRRAFSGGHR